MNQFIRRHGHALIIFCSLALWSPLSAQADWGIWEAGIFLDINGGGLSYQNATNFDGTHIGDFVTGQGDSLVLLGGEAKTFKNGGSDVTGATFHYRITAIDSAPGSPSDINLPFNADLGGGDQVWNTGTESIDILGAVSRPGTYRLEFYVSATGTNPNETKFFSNLGDNYVATFNYNIPVLEVNGVNANYTTTKFFVNEVSGDSYPVNVTFWPNGDDTLTDVEVFSNLNRRDWAAKPWTNEHGVVTEEGIYPRPGHTILAGMTSHYYAAHPMQVVTPDEEYQLTLNAEKTGAYRLSARYRVQGDTNWYWYTDSGMGRRDHAVVISPITSRDMVMYEVNTLNMKATGTLESQRSTFVDLWDGPGSDPAKPAWNMSYLQSLGVNWLWFQPVHPYGEDGRHLSAANINSRSPGAGASTWLWNGGSDYEDVNYPYDLGSPYAVKNFWAIEPLMSKGNTRAAAMAEFTNFVNAASAEGVNVMLDAAFNHTAWDVELGDLGVELFAPGASPTDEIRNWEARVFSKDGNYDQRAASAGDIAPAPDRFDFGKWIDVFDIFFGRYAALVPNAGEPNRFENEEDWFDYSHGAPGYFDQITQNVWKYFGAYVPYWLEKTGYTAGTPPEDIHVGIDGLRCDFGQGLPPQAWEYIINRARSVKWNFVFMAETLDGGAPPYRSNRHFDILNENILFAMKGTTETPGYRSIFEDRRNAFGEGLVLLNTVSHDEDNYSDPWAALLRYGVMSTIDGVPMIFPGQELGISTLYGYDLMEKNFGKYIPHFKTFNSLMPLWNDTDFGNDQLYPVYAGINRARRQSPALRSSNRYFINQTGGGGVHNQIFSVAKYEEAGASPAVSDVVFGFVNVDRDNQRQGNFDVNIGHNGGNLFGIKNDRQYNIRNIAAHTGIIPDRDEWWLWGSDRDGSDIVTNGVFVSLHGVPSNAADWELFPFEAQYLKLYDVTAPPGLATAPAHTNGQAYAIGESATFAWDAVSDPEGGAILYAVVINDGSSTTTNFTSDTSYEVTGSHGDEINVTVQPVNAHQIANRGGASPASDSVHLLDPVGDEDSDGMFNWEEDLALTDPLDENSVFEVESAMSAVGATERHITFTAQPGRSYRILYTDDDLTAASITWQAFASSAQGEFTHAGGSPVSHTFTDDEGPDTSNSSPAEGKRFYRIEVFQE